MRPGGTLGKRRGDVPLTTALILLGAAIAGVMIMVFYFTTTRAATSQPILAITDAYYVGGNLMFTVRNLGAVDCSPLTLRKIRCGNTEVSPSPPPSSSLKKGTSEAFTVSGVSSIPDGSLCVAVLQCQTATGATNSTVSFQVVAP
jgi:hypothetical protein